MTQLSILDEGTVVLLLPAFTIMGLLWAAYELWRRGRDSNAHRQEAGPNKKPQHRTKAMALKARSSLLDTHGNVILLWRVRAELYIRHLAANTPTLLAETRRPWVVGPSEYSRVDQFCICVGTPWHL